MSTSSPQPRRHVHLTWAERAIALGVVALSVVTGTLFASLMPWPRAGLVFAALWGAVLSAITVGLVGMRLQDRMRHLIHTLDRKIAQTPRVPIIPSYAITPEAPPIIAPHLPVRHHTPTPPPRRSFHTLDELSGETLVDDIPQVTIDREEDTVQERQMPTEPLEGFADILSSHDDAQQEETLDEVARPTQNLEVPGAVLMSMAEIDAEMTPVHAPSLSAREAQAATRPFTTPAPILSEMMAHQAAAHEEVTLQAPPQEHFANRATIPLDANVIQSFLSDQRSTQKIEDIPEFVSQALSRRRAQESE